MLPNDTQLKQALAKMLPEDTYFDSSKGLCHWPIMVKVLDTELLHLCWLVEETIPMDKQADYIKQLSDSNTVHATWQQRVIAMCKVKGITI